MQIRKCDEARRERVTRNLLFVLMEKETFVTLQLFLRQAGKTLINSSFVKPIVAEGSTFLTGGNRDSSTQSYLQARAKR
jgi:hypothetical protein